MPRWPARTPLPPGGRACRRPRRSMPPPLPAHRETAASRRLGESGGGLLPDDKVAIRARRRSTTCGNLHRIKAEPQAQRRSSKRMAASSPSAAAESPRRLDARSDLGDLAAIDESSACGVPPRAATARARLLRLYPRFARSSPPSAAGVLPRPKPGRTAPALALFRECRGERCRRQQLASLRVFSAPFSSAARRERLHAAAWPTCPRDPGPGSPRRREPIRCWRASSAPLRDGPAPFRHCLVTRDSSASGRDRAPRGRRRRSCGVRRAAANLASLERARWRARRGSRSSPATVGVERRDEPSRPPAPAPARRGLLQDDRRRRSGLCDLGDPGVGARLADRRHARRAGRGGGCAAGDDHDSRERTIDHLSVRRRPFPRPLSPAVRAGRGRTLFGRASHLRAGRRDAAAAAQPAGHRSGQRRGLSGTRVGPRKGRLRLHRHRMAREGARHQHRGLGALVPRRASDRAVARAARISRIRRERPGRAFSRRLRPPVRRPSRAPSAAGRPRSGGGPSRPRSFARRAPRLPPATRPKPNW